MLQEGQGLELGRADNVSVVLFDEIAKQIEIVILIHAYPVVQPCCCRGVDCRLSRRTATASTILHIF